MFISSLNDYTKVVFLALDAMQIVVCSYCHVFVFLSERYRLDLEEIFDVFLRNEISSKAISIFSMT